jgi:hypothetical protein
MCIAVLNKIKHVQTITSSDRDLDMHSCARRNNSANLNVHQTMSFKRMTPLQHVHPDTHLTKCSAMRTSTMHVSVIKNYTCTNLPTMHYPKLAHDALIQYTNCASHKC